MSITSVMDKLKMSTEERKLYFSKDKTRIQQTDVQLADHERVGIFNSLSNADKERVTGTQLDDLTLFFHYSVATSFVAWESPYQNNPGAIFEEEAREIFSRSFSNLTRIQYKTIAGFPDSFNSTSLESLHGFESFLSNASFGYRGRMDVAYSFPIQPLTELTKDLSIPDYAICRGIESGLYNIRDVQVDYINSSDKSILKAMEVLLDYENGKNSNSAKEPGFYKSIEKSSLPGHVKTILYQVIEEHETTLTDETVDKVSDDIIYLMDQMQQGNWNEVSNFLNGYSVEQFIHAVEIYAPSIQKAGITNPIHEFTREYIQTLQ